jgi:hypothetical protein
MVSNCNLEIGGAASGKENPLTTCTGSRSTVQQKK